MKTSELLERSLEVLRERGWTQGAYEDIATGSVCALGAGLIAQDCSCFELVVPLGDLNRFRVAVERTRKALAPFVPGGTIGTFNDDPTTTYEDIELMFKHAIAAHQELEELTQA